MKGLYIRVSTQEQATEGYSIKEQTERLKKYCEAMGWRDYKIYTDGGYSGGNINRPALQDLMKAVKAGKIDKVIVYKLDRLSRSQKDTLYLIEDVFLASGCDFISMSENFDTSTPFGRAMIGILAVFAQLEREQIKERMNMGREGRAKKGKWKGGGADPFGYDYIDGKLVINEYEAMIVREIFDRFIGGESVQKIAVSLNERGLRTKLKSKWGNPTCRLILLNPIYCGYIKYNDNIFKGEHEAIISEETMQQAAAIMTRRGSKFEKSRNGNTYTNYLGGLLYCGNCGARYHHHKTITNGVYYNYYVCYSRSKSSPHMVIDATCKNRNFSMDKLNRIIFDEIKKLALDADYIRQLKEANQERVDNAASINAVEKELAKIDSQRSRLIDLYSLGSFSIEELQGKIQPLTEQRVQLQTELERLTAGNNGISEDDALAIVSTFEEVLERGVFEEIRLVIDSLIERITIFDDRLVIKWRFI